LPLKKIVGGALKIFPGQVKMKKTYKKKGKKSKTKK